ncbi:MAG: tetratricopeptide repeat protein, partial [Elusimicrobia bacterium]|nr:tetratricopeptide repeat protein [Elusimicrobiota bacterium]
AELAAKLAPESGAAHRALAVALRRGEKADPQRRQDEVLIALDLDPKDADAWYEYWRVRGYDPDDETIRRALELEPRHLGAHIDLGAALVEEGRLDEAAERLMEALRLNPRNALAAYDLAMVFNRQGHAERALELLRKARKLHPDERLLAAGMAAVEVRDG